jgi:hypothetical protein
MKIKFSQCAEFEKDFKALYKKYPSLEKDLALLKKAMEVSPIVPHAERINNLGEDIILPIYKARKVACKYLKNSTTLRVIYAYDDKNDVIQFIEFVEIYAK